MIALLVIASYIVGMSFAFFFTSKMRGWQGMEEHHCVICAFWPVALLPWLGFTYGNYCHKKQMDRKAIVDQVKKRTWSLRSWNGFSPKLYALCGRLRLCYDSMVQVV